jgi:hypothetical protein
MNAILQTLVKLQNLEFGSPLAVSKNETEAGALRAGIPPALLDHYDRFRARGKKGIALLVNQVCTGCHMSVTTAKLTHVMRGTEVQRCESCGRYLCLVATPAPTEAVPEVAAAAPVKKKRKRKELAVAA